MKIKAIKRRLVDFAPGIVMLLTLIGIPFILGTVGTGLITKIITFALLTMALDISFGYAGLWSICHAAIFGVAGYTVALFMTYLDITSFWIVAPAGITAATITSLIFALIALRASGIYFLLITFALGQMIYVSTIVWNKWTHDFDGIPGIPYPQIGLDFTSISFYYFTLIIFAICVFLLIRLINSPFGYSLQGIRESDKRMRALGYNTWLHKFLAFIISGFFAGVAGVLFAHHNGIMTPPDTGLAASGLILVMIIIGGAGTLWGGLIGSAIIFFLHHYVSSITTDRWVIVLGAIYVAAAMLKRGIFPILNDFWIKNIKRWHF